MQAYHWQHRSTIKNLLLLLQRRHHHKHFLKFIMKKSLPLICHSIPLSPPGVATVMFFPLTALRRNAFFCCLHAFYKRYSMNTGCTRVGYPAWILAFWEGEWRSLLCRVFLSLLLPHLAFVFLVCQPIYQGGSMLDSFLHTKLLSVLSARYTRLPRTRGRIYQHR